MRITPAARRARVSLNYCLAVAAALAFASCENNTGDDGGADGDRDGGDFVGGDAEPPPEIPLNHWDDLCPAGGSFASDRDCPEPEIDAATLEGKSGIFPGLPLIHDQLFVLPENAEVGDTAGELNLQWIADDQDVTFSLPDDDGGRFTIDADGVISVATANFDYDPIYMHHVTARATLSGGGYDEATITFKLLPEDRIIFIDPTWTGDENGTRAEPLASWTEAAPFFAGRVYLMKRGTTDSGGLYIDQGGSAEEPVIIGAYGAGPRPRISRTINPDIYCVRLGSFAPYLQARYIDVNSLEIDTCLGIRSVSGANHLAFNDLEIHNTDETGGIYFFHDESSSPGTEDQLNDVYMTDLHAHHHVSGAGIYASGGGVVARNLHLHDNWTHGIAFAAYWSYGNDVRYVRAHNNDASGLESAGVAIGGNATTLSWSRTTANGIGVLIHDGAGARVSHIITDNNDEHGVSVHLQANDIIIERVESFGNYHGVRARQSSYDITIRFNDLHDNTHFGVSLYRTDGLGGPHDVEVSYNLIYDNTDPGLRLLEARNIDIYNNTFYANGGTEDIQVEDFTPNLYIRNNLFEIGIGGSDPRAQESNNLKHTADYFENASGRDFHLVAGSPAIDAGMYVGLIKDYDGNAVPNGDEVDVGAFEY